MYKRFSMILMSLLMATIMIACGRNAEDESREDEAEEYYEEGRNYLYGLEGYEIDLEAAYECFVEAEESGERDANYYLGRLYDDYGYPEKDYVKAKEYYDACGRDPYAQLALGFLYYYGNGVIEDKELAEEIFEEVVDEGCVEGYFGMAMLAEDEEDYSTAFEYYNKALEGTEEGVLSDAMIGCGYLYENGLGVEQDYNMAMEWYEKAAKLGDSMAMNNIGYMYKRGTGVEQDYAKAMEWYEKAVELGSSVAMNNIAYMYSKGEGVELDYAKAVEWYEKAVALNDAVAMDGLGYMYFYGYGVEQDYYKALEWYEKAYEFGYEPAGNNAEYIKQLLD